MHAEPEYSVDISDVSTSTLRVVHFVCRLDGYTMGTPQGKSITPALHVDPVSVFFILPGQVTQLVEYPFDIRVVSL